jgi:hypothetical protein
VLPLCLAKAHYGSFLQLRSLIAGLAGLVAHHDLVRVKPLAALRRACQSPLLESIEECVSQSRYYNLPYLCKSLDHISDVKYTTMSMLSTTWRTETVPTLGPISKGD